MVDYCLVAIIGIALFVLVILDLIDELKRLNREDIMVIVGGVIPPQDYNYLYQKGVVAIFGPGSVISDCGIRLLEILIETRK